MHPIAPRPHRPRLSAGALGLLLSAAAATLGACGSSPAGTEADPATVAPATAPLYVSVALKPPGGSSSEAMVAARKLTHLEDPYGSLAQSLLSVPSSRPKFKRDLAPWIGRRAGIFLTSLDLKAAQGQTGGPGPIGALLAMVDAGAFGANGAQGAIVLDTSDVARARSFLGSQADAQAAKAASYRGVSYRLSFRGVAEGVVKRFAVIGSESGLKSVIDASLGGGALDSAPGYVKPSAQAIATAFLAPDRFAAGLSGSPGATAAGVGLLGGLFAGAKSAALSVLPSRDSLSIQGDIRYDPRATRLPARAGSGVPLLGQAGSQALGALPGGAWLAAGVGGLGSNLPRVLRLVGGAASLGASTVFSSLGGAGLQTLAARLDSQAGAIGKDFAPWAGPAGAFVSGTGLFNVEAALVIASRDPAASRAAVGRLAKLLAGRDGTVDSAAIAGTDAAATVKLTGLPVVLYIADGRSTGGQQEFVIGLGQASILGALNSASPLSSSPSYSAASQALGEGLKPSLILEFPTLLGFLEGAGLTQNPPLSELVPYLKSLGTLTAGATTQGSLTRFRAVLGLAGNG